MDEKLSGQVGNRQLSWARVAASAAKQRAVDLTKTAIRLNPDPQAETLYAALLERHERDALLVQELSSAAPAPAIYVAG